MVADFRDRHSLSRLLELGRSNAPNSRLPVPCLALVTLALRWIEERPAMTTPRKRPADDQQSTARDAAMQTGSSAHRAPMPGAASGPLTARDATPNEPRRSP